MRTSLPDAFFEPIDQPGQEFKNPGQGRSRFGRRDQGRNESTHTVWRAARFRNKKPTIATAAPAISLIMVSSPHPRAMTTAPAAVIACRIKELIVSFIGFLFVS